MVSIRKRSIYLLIYMSILFIFQCPNRVYNAWAGPFTMHSNQFHHHLETYYGRANYLSYFLFHRYFFHSEYIQLELGQNGIDLSTQSTLGVFYGHYSYGRLLYTYHRVREPTIDTSDIKIYVKFTANEEQSGSERRYPYKFQSFSVTTLQCIINQLVIFPLEHTQWLGKSYYIEKIEKFYDRNTRVFNNRVIKKCGILIGYLYQPSKELVYTSDLYGHYEFSKKVRIFDVSSSYTPYISYVLMGLFICVLFKNIVYPTVEIIYLRFLPLLRIYNFLKQQMKELNINSLKDFEKLLLTTHYQNNHYDRLFIVDDKYLIMLMVDLDENNERILRQYYTDTPLVIVLIDNINKIQQDCVVLKINGYIQRIYFPEYLYSTSFNPSDWLHERLMVISDRYRYK